MFWTFRAHAMVRTGRFVYGRTIASESRRGGGLDGLLPRINARRGGRSCAKASTIGTWLCVLLSTSTMCLRLTHQKRNVQKRNKSEFLQFNWVETWETCFVVELLGHLWGALKMLLWRINWEEQCHLQLYLLTIPQNSFTPTLLANTSTFFDITLRSFPLSSLKHFV